MRRRTAVVTVIVAVIVQLTGGLRPPLATAAADEPKDFATLKYRSVGPYAGGRVSRACGVPGDPLTYYAATASGGVWKSADGGLTWKPIFDDQPTSSIGSIAVAPTDPNVVYVGSGEANIRGNVSPGAGLFRSTDAGKSWQHVWKQVGQIGTIAVHPKNADIAYAAVLGHAFGPNPERGVYRTTDGGTNWTRVLFKDDETGCSDVCIDPSNPRVIFAGFWQTRRRPWEMTSGGPGSDLYVSRDGGDTWESLKASGGRKPPVADDKDDGDALPTKRKERKLEAKAGLNRFVWDLTHDGADPIPGSAADSGSAGQGVPVSPGTYTVKLIVGNQTQTQTVEVKPDPRLPATKPTAAIPMADATAVLAAAPAAPAGTDQEKLGLRLRDDISKLADAVGRIRSVKKQIEALEKKLDALEEKLHNARAKISYDIFAARGGAMLYSQFIWLLTSVTDGVGPPTKAQLELADDLEQQLAVYQSAFDALAKGDVAKLNESAKTLGVPELYVPPAKKN